MSLLNTASPWNNENLSSSSKKKPSMKRIDTSKIRAYDKSELENNDSLQTQNGSIESMETIQKSNEENSLRIRSLIDKLADDNDGSELANYTPIDRPEVNSLSNNDIQKDAGYLHIDPNELLPKTLERQPSNFESNDLSLGKLTNYSNSYTTKMTDVNKPYYAKMGIGNDSSKLLEKINYMIHLLEEQQIEKTANITEEFILYTFLGVFVIFIVDSFTRTGKYVR
jgi:hypothetical protein